jgi:predicted glycosyltransferase
LKSPYAIIRFVGWFANHDVGNNGFTLEEKTKLVETIAKNMTVYISSEKPLPEPLSQYKLNTPASLIHDVLSYADLYVGDSQTMAAESALLGTHSIRSNSFVGPNDMSNFKILESKYGLLRNIAKPQDAIDLAAEWSAHSQKNEWKNKQKDYYTQVGDINANIVSLLTNI